MGFSRIENTFVVLFMMAVFITGISFALSPYGGSPEGRQDINNQTAAISEIPVYVPPEKLSNPPEIVKAVYITAWSAGTKKYLDYLSNLFEKTEINAVVVDIKDYSGTVSYKSGPIKDIDALIRFFHGQNIYAIGRISVFEDPVYAEVRPELAVHDAENAELWQDNKGLFWMDPASKDVWDYNISLAKDALYHGFDEINFDYVRFPSDGNMENIAYPVWDEKTPMAEVIKSFFQYVRASLSGEKISVDLFGQTTTNTDDMGIGQMIEHAFENFDYICPMIYPSHYIKGFMGFSNPAEHPYEVVKYSLDSALARQLVFGVFNSKFRPWLQDFDIGADYNAEMVQSEIKAAQDALGDDYNGFMLWNPSNIYTTQAVLKDIDL